MKRDYVTVPKAAERTGLTLHAIRGYIKRDDWIEGIHYQRAPNNKITIDMEAIYDWLESGTNPGKKR